MFDRHLCDGGQTILAVGLNTKIFDLRHQNYPAFQYTHHHTIYYARKRCRMSDTVGQKYKDVLLQPVTFCSTQTSMLFGLF